MSEIFKAGYRIRLLVTKMPYFRGKIFKIFVLKKNKDKTKEPLKIRIV